MAKTWKQYKCPWTDEWMKKMQYIHTIEYYSTIKKKEIMPFAATWMNLEMIILSQLDRERQISYDIAYMWYLKKKMEMNLFIKWKQTHRLKKKKIVVTSGRRVSWGGIDCEFGIDINTLLYLKGITNKDLLYSTGNAAQYYATI